MPLSSKVTLTSDWDNIREGETISVQQCRGKKVRNRSLLDQQWVRDSSISQWVRDSSISHRPTKAKITYSALTQGFRILLSLR